MEPDLVHIAILAGGQSRRMGHNKALLQLHGQPLIEHVLSAARPLALPTFVVGDPTTYPHLKLPVHPDLYPDLGPIGGLYTALEKAAGPVLLLACDLPFLTPEFLRYILSRRGNHQAIVPRTKEGTQPLCALYELSCLTAIETAIAAKQLSMRRLLSALNVDEIEQATWRAYDKRNLLFANLNTPEEFERVQKSLE